MKYTDKQGNQVSWCNHQDMFVISSGVGFHTINTDLSNMLRMHPPMHDEDLKRLAPKNFYR